MMPSIAIPRRRSRSVEDEDDVSNDSSDSGGPRSAESRKRTRLSNDVPTTPDEPDDSWVLSPPNTVSRAGNQNVTMPSRPVRPSSTIATNPRTVLDDTGSLVQTLNNGERPKHQAGAIVRVTMKNFVTYTYAEFNPGPALNMIIGPNGTGKSTLVCALCLGLGWGPQHLGRAKDIGEFVKHGHSEASIEIELQGHNGHTNTIVRRQIKKEGNKSTWFLNGNTANQKAVQNAAKTYSIQIDNLCQFLPQDRVAEFAAMDNKDLLLRTQQAAAPPHVQEWHDELKNLRKEQDKEEMEQKSIKTQLDQLQARQDRQRPDVERIQARQEVELLVDNLKKSMPYAHWVKVKMQSEEAKQKHEEKAAEARKLDAELSPLLESYESKKAYKEKLEVFINQKEAMTKRCDKYANEKHAAFEKAKSDLEKSKNVIDAKKRAINKDALMRIKREIERLKLRKAEAPPEYDKAFYLNAIREHERLLNEVDDQLTALKESKRDKGQRITSCEGDIEKANHELSKLRTKTGQQEKKVAQKSQETAKAWDWLKRNREDLNLKGMIYGPPIVECSVKDPKYVAGIESLFRDNDFLAFTCDNREDFETVRKCMQTKGFDNITIRVADLPLDSFQRPVSDEEMRAMGIEGWAVDQIIGPEPVLSMLTFESKLHTTGVTLKEMNTQEYERMAQSSISSCINGDKIFKINRRKEYGPKAVATTVTKFTSRGIWSEQQVDSGEERTWKQKIAESTHDKEQYQQEQEDLENQIKRHNERRTDVDSERVRLREEKTRKEAAMSEYAGLDTRLEHKETELRVAEEQQIKRLEEIEEAKREQRDKAEKKSQIALELARLVEQLRLLHQEHITAKISFIEASSDVETISSRNENITNLINSAKEEADKAKRDHTRLRSEYKKIMSDFKKQLDEDESLRDFLESLSEEARNRTPGALQNEIEAQEARLAMLAGGDVNIIREFEKGARDIDELRSKLSDADDTLTSLEQSINSTRAKWEPEVDALVGKISSAFAESFASIQCAGSVSVIKAGEHGRDFENWAIDLQVSFREGETMASLDSQRQSGGERAVSTIFYLMALQTLSRAPFRVVDEINQGMDPRNERKVHERMVNIACGADEFGGQTSQYFLITPKLLTGLKYSDNMTVHCIASGEYMPTDPSVVDFRKALAEVRKSRAANTTTSWVDGVGA